MLDILADQAIMRGLVRGGILPELATLRALPILERTRKSWWQESQPRQAGASWLVEKLRVSVHPATHLEFGEQRRNMELDGSHG